MPAYNADKYIGEAIESILHQTFTDFEFIIIDDGSKDNTWRIMEEYSKKDKRITIVKNEKNLGIAETRNKLISLSKSSYIVWQDSDDISMPYRIEHQYNFMEKHKDVGICGGYLRYFDSKGDLGLREYALNDKEIRKTIFRYSPVAQPAAIVRKECFENTGMFPTVSLVAEDLAVSFQIGTKYKFANLPEVLIRYRQVASGATFSKLRIMEMFTLFLRMRYSYTNPESYTMSAGDKIYNTIQYLSVFLIPPKFKIWLFNLIRNI